MEKLPEFLHEYLDKVSPEMVKHVQNMFTTFKKKYEDLKWHPVPAEIVNEAFRDIDEVIRNTDKSVLDAIACSKGCSACCNIRLNVTSAEAARIVFYLAKNHDVMPNEDRARKQFEAVKKDSGNSKDWNEKVPPEVRPCMFLKDDLCQIYPVRPLCCRTLHVAKKSEMCCAKAFKNDGSVTLVTNLFAEVIRAAFYEAWGHSGDHMALAMNKVAHLMKKTFPDKFSEKG